MEETIFLKEKLQIDNKPDNNNNSRMNYQLPTLSIL
jgi:hypothetical protein